MATSYLLGSENKLSSRFDFIVNLAFSKWTHLDYLFLSATIDT
nr:MAG TPA: hypothetical protein [Caudoviricetes sp.]